MTLCHILYVCIVNWITMTRTSGEHLRTTYGNTGQLLTLLGLISCVYRDLHHWGSNHRPQIADPKLYNWIIRKYRTEVIQNYLVKITARPINLNVSCLASYIRTLLQRTRSPPGPRNSIHRIIPQLKNVIYIYIYIYKL